MSRRYSRLERLFGSGAPAFCAAFDLVPVFLHRAIPFKADGVLNLVTDLTEQRRRWPRTT